MSSFFNTKTYKNWRAKQETISVKEKVVENPDPVPTPAIVMREKNGQFVKGRQAFPNHKRKGVPKRHTIESKDRAERLLKFIEGEFLEADVRKLSPFQRTSLYRDILEWRQPKLSRSIISDADGKTIAVKQVFVIGGSEYSFTQASREGE